MNAKDQVQPEPARQQKHHALLNELGDLCARFATQEGQNPTAIPYFEVLRSRKPTAMQFGILQPSFCVIVQGYKRVLVGSEVLAYGPGHYLASLLRIPVAGQIVSASHETPYLGLRVTYSNEELSAVMLEAGLSFEALRSPSAGAFSARASDEVLQSFCKLFELLAGKPSAYLAGLAKKELIYHLLTSEAGPAFAHNLLINPQSLGLRKALSWIQAHYDQSLSIEDLARDCHMSVSSLHHKFKAFAAMGPLQYQKQMRLTEARRLLLSGEADSVTQLAFRLGYESASQFSREYRRQFGLPPVEDLKALRQPLGQAQGQTLDQPLAIS